MYTYTYKYKYIYIYIYIYYFLCSINLSDKYYFFFNLYLQNYIK